MKLMKRVEPWTVIDLAKPWFCELTDGYIYNWPIRSEKSILISLNRSRPYSQFADSYAEKQILNARDVNGQDFSRIYTFI